MLVVEWSRSARIWHLATSMLLVPGGLGTRTDFLRPIRPGHPSPRGEITPTTVHLLLQLSRLSRITVPQHQSRMRMVICREHYLARRTSCLGVLLPAHNLWWANSARRCHPTHRRSTSARCAISGSRAHRHYKRICTVTLGKNVSTLWYFSLKPSVLTLKLAFACDVEGCGRHFSVVSNLRRHKKVHKGEKENVSGGEEE